MKNNYYLCKNNVDYISTKFIESSKIFKEIINIFFDNFDLTPIQEQLSYKNVNKMWVL